MSEFKFKDKNGKEWDCTLDLGKAQAIDNSKFDIFNIKEFSILQPDKATFTALLTNINLLFFVIWIVVRDQAQANLGFNPNTGETPEDKANNEDKAQALFVASLNGQSIEHGRNAFMRALGDFFPEQKTALSLLMEQWKNGRNLLEKEIGSMGEEFKTAMETELTEKMAAVKTALKSATPLASLEKLNIQGG